MAAKANLVQDRIGYVLTKVALDPDFVADRKLQLWPGPGKLEDAEGPARWRFFRVDVAEDGRGVTCSNQSVRYTASVFEIVCGYPDHMQLPGDLLRRGVSGMAASDAARVRQMMVSGPFLEIGPGHPAYDAAVGTLPALQFVRSPLFKGRRYDGRTSRLRYAIEVGEERV